MGRALPQTPETSTRAKFSHYLVIFGATTATLDIARLVGEFEGLIGFDLSKKLHSLIYVELFLFVIFTNNSLREGIHLSLMTEVVGGQTQKRGCKHCVDGSTQVRCSQESV